CGVRPVRCRPSARMVSTCSGQGSISVTSCPARVMWPPAIPPMAPAPTTTMRLPKMVFSKNKIKIKNSHRDHREHRELQKRQPKSHNINKLLFLLDLLPFSL